MNSIHNCFGSDWTSMHQHIDVSAFSTGRRTGYQEPFMGPKRMLQYEQRIHAQWLQSITSPYCHWQYECWNIKSWEEVFPAAHFFVLFSLWDNAGEGTISAFCAQVKQCSGRWLGEGCSQHLRPAEGSFWFLDTSAPYRHASLNNPPGCTQLDLICTTCPMSIPCSTTKLV